MHAYIEAFTKTNPNASYPWKLDAGWEDIEIISGLTKEKILATLGFSSVDMFIVLATCYFTYPSTFQERLPELNTKMNLLFKG